jgi:hypothetical protein
MQTYKKQLKMKKKQQSGMKMKVKVKTIFSGYNLLPPGEGTPPNSLK